MAGHEPVDAAPFQLIDGTIRLLGTRCRTCGEIGFPAQPTCARCTGEETEAIELPLQGDLWTWTTQGFAPKDPYDEELANGFKPFYVGFIDLGGTVLVAGRLLLDRPPRIGERMRVVDWPFTFSDGRVRSMFGFTSDE